MWRKHSFVLSLWAMVNLPFYHDEHLTNRTEHFILYIMYMEPFYSSIKKIKQSLKNNLTSFVLCFYIFFRFFVFSFDIFTVFILLAFVI